MKARPDAIRWYQAPVLWLGLVVFLASLAGCVWVIVAGVRSADPPVAEAHGRVLLDMPTHHAPHHSRPPARRP